MTRLRSRMDELGPWSLTTSRQFWEGFAPAALTLAPGGGDQPLVTVFRVEADWSRAEASVTQHGADAVVEVTGDGDLDAATEQVRRFLALDIDARTWPDVGGRDRIIADAQTRFPGLRPCGFHSPYEAATWAVLSQRIRIVQAARLREDLVARHGDADAFPAPQKLRTLDLDLPGRKTEYLHAVAAAALDGLLDGAALRSVEPDQALTAVQQITGIGPFAAELIVLRGANTPDAFPRHERRLEAEIAERYGSAHDPHEVADIWRPFRTWAAVHLRALRELRTHEINDVSARGSRA